MLIAGIDLPGTDGHTLVDVLLRIGRDADLALAHRIERGYSRQAKLMVLSPQETDLLLGVLDDPPEGGLSELRDTLLRDWDWRHSEGVA